MTHYLSGDTNQYFITIAVNNFVELSLEPPIKEISRNKSPLLNGAVFGYILKNAEIYISKFTAESAYRQRVLLYLNVEKIKVVLIYIG
jgi:hypothetical protein